MANVLEKQVVMVNLIFEPGEISVSVEAISFQLSKVFAKILDIDDRALELVLLIQPELFERRKAVTELGC